MNTKNLLQFNQIKFKDFEECNFHHILKTNILKEYSLNNYIDKTFIFHSIQKNSEINNCCKSDIQNILVINNQNKMVFNTEYNIYLLNIKNNLIQDKIKTKEQILSTNLIEEGNKEIILVTFNNSIKKLNIEHDKIKLVDFLINVEVSEPGKVIKYKDEYVWTNGSCIEFTASPTYYCQMENIVDDYVSSESSHDLKVINLTKFNDTFLFVIFHEEIYLSQSFHYYNLYLVSYRKGFIRDYFIEFENFDFVMVSNWKEIDYIINMQKDYNIHIVNSNEIIVIGKLGLYFINPSKWIIEKKIIFSYKLIENAFYLNNSYFLIYTRKYFFENQYKEESKNAEILNINEKNNILIAKIETNFTKIIYDAFLDFEEEKIYYNSNIDDNTNEFNNQFILYKNNNISFYEFASVEKKIEMKNN